MIGPTQGIRDDLPSHCDFENFSSIPTVTQQIQQNFKIIHFRLSSKSLQIINAGEDVEKRELSYTAGGNVDRCSHGGKQYRGALKTTKQSYHMIQ